jgi:hypothetical protein
MPPRKGPKPLKSPLQELKGILKMLLDSVDGSTWFSAPVNPKVVPNYYDVISDPQDLGTIKVQACPPTARGAALIPHLSLCLSVYGESRRSSPNPSTPVTCLR